VNFAERTPSAAAQSFLKELVQSTLKRFGLRLVRLDSNLAQSNGAQPNVPPPDAGLHSFFGAFKRLGFDPSHIIDVGANRGTWTRKALQYFPDAQYTLIEPQDHLKPHIQDLLDRGCKITWINAGVGDKSGTLPFTISHRDDSSSFAPTSVDAGAPQISVPVLTLNEIVSAGTAPLPAMVKIDAEGFDLKVLAGASDLLGRTEVFFVEAAAFCPGLKNTIANVVRRMDEAGYRAVDITDINRSPRYGVLWLCELAFLRNASPLLASVKSYEEPSMELSGSQTGRFR
jgi:FkbM family methyltransferase